MTPICPYRETVVARSLGWSIIFLAISPGLKRLFLTICSVPARTTDIKKVDLSC